MKYSHFVIFILAFSTKVFGQVNVNLSLNNNSIPENGGTATITATLSEVHSQDVYIDFIRKGNAKFDLDYDANFVTKGEPSTFLNSSNNVSSPYSIYYAADGSFYFYSGCSIYKVDSGATTSHLVAGGMGCGNTLTQFGSFIPHFVVDTSKNIYIVDESNHRILKWKEDEPSGTIVAGGNGFGNALNQLYNPCDIKIDTNGYMYILERNNNRILKWKEGETSGVLFYSFTTIASPNSFDFDSNGDFYVSNYNSVRKWDHMTYLSKIIAGGNGMTTENQLSSVTNIKIDNRSFLYLTDHSNNRIRKNPKNDITGITIAGGNGGGSAQNQLNGPYGIALDNLSNLFVGDASNNRIQRYQYSPQIKIPAGETTGSVTFNAINDDLYEDSEIIDLNAISRNATIIGSENFSISIVDNDPLPALSLSISDSLLLEESMDSIPVTARLNKVSGQNTFLKFSFGGTAQKGADYLSSTDTLVIPEGDSLTTFYLKSINDNLVEIKKNILISIDSSNGIANIYPNANIALSSEDQPSVSFNLAQNSIPEEGGQTQLSVSLSEPTSRDVIIDFDMKGSAWYDGDYEADFNTKGNISTVAGGNGNGSALNQLYAPTDVKVDSLGSLFISDQANHRIVKWNKGSTAGSIVAGGNSTGNAANQLISPQRIFLEKNGDLLIADYGNHRIQKWSNGATAGVTVAGSAIGLSGSTNQLLNQPTSIFKTGTTLLISDKRNYRIQKYDHNIGLTFHTVEDINLGETKMPIDISIDESNNLWYSDYNSIKKINLITKEKTALFSDPNQLPYLNISNVKDILPYKNGSFYVTDSDNQKVLKVNNSGNSTTVAGGNGAGPLNIQLSAPSGLDVDLNGNLFISDEGNHRIQKVQFAPQIIIPAGQITGQLIFKAIPDNMSEINEIAEIYPLIINAFRSESTPISLTIVDNDLMPEINISSKDSVQLEESSDSLLVTFNLNKKAGKDTFVRLTFSGAAVLGQDYTVDKTQLVIKNGDSLGYVFIKPLNDNTIEVLENISIAIDSSTNIQTSYPNLTLAISSEDKPGIQLYQDLSNITEAGGIANITATLAQPTARDVIIDLNYAGSAIYRGDYEAEFNSKGKMSVVAGGNGLGNNNNQLNSPFDITFDDQQNMYISQASSTIKKWKIGEKEGGYFINNPGSGISQLDNPKGIDFFDNQLYVADFYNHRVQKFNLNNGQGTIVAGGNGPGSANNQLSNPIRVKVSSDGKLYVADHGNYRIQRFLPFNNIGTTIAGGNGPGSNQNQLGTIFGLSLNRDENILFESYFSIIQYFKIDKASFGKSNILNFYQNVYPNSFDIDKANNMYIVNRQYYPGFENPWVSNFLFLKNGSSIPDTILSYHLNNNLYNTLNISSLKLDKYNNVYLVNPELQQIQRYQLQPQIVIPAGQTTGIIKFVAIEDYDNEPNEKIALKPVATNGTLANSDSLFINILENRIQLTPQANLGIPALIRSATSWGDFDRDGDQDLAVMGYSFASGIVSKIYKNEGDTLVASNLNIERLQSGDIQWVDINKDGYLDLMACGLDLSNQKRTVLYVSDSARNFAKNDSLGIINVSSGKIAFGDLNSDGEPDLAILGLDDNNAPILKLYEKRKNQIAFDLISDFSLTPGINAIEGELKIADFDLDGDNDILFEGGYINNSYLEKGNFQLIASNAKYEVAKLFNDESTLTVMGLGIESGTPLFFSNQYINIIGGAPELKNGDIAVGDYNNDGLNDILFSGIDATNNVKTLLYYQKTDKTFHLVPNTLLTNMYKSSADWVDYDNDGDLDLFMTGLDGLNIQKTIFYKNEPGTKINHAPEKPVNLQFNDLGNGFVQISWAKGNDDFSSYLGYNIRLGTTPGGSELSNPHSNLGTGSRLITETPPLFKNSYITQLNPGKYYWSVQAIDQGYLGSPFADEQSFTLQYDWKLVNHGGIVDRRFLNINKPKMALLDIDNDNDMDMVVGSESTRKVYLYDGKIFRLSTNNLGYEWLGVENMVAGDLNNDGLTDIAVNSTNKQLEIYLNNGGTFSNVYASSTIGLVRTKMKVQDTDNDGKQEIIIAGVTSNTDAGTPKFYNLEWNGSAFESTNLTSQIEQFLYASYDFGDFNNDAKIDFLVSGGGNNGLETRLYENLTFPGDPISFSPVSTTLSSTYLGTSDLNDLDSDGDLDILLTGTSISGDIFNVFNNNLVANTSTFVNKPVSIQALHDSKIAFGDFNNDGFQDIFYSGIQNGMAKVTRLAEYDSQTQDYINSNFQYGDLTDAEVSFGDIDNDNDLDMILGGNDATNSNNKIFRVLLNVRNESSLVNASPAAGLIASGTNRNARLKTTADAEDFKLNSPPAQPSPVSVTKVSNGNKHSLHFEWNKSTDDNTPVNGLYYNLRIGTTAENDNVIASNSHLTGVRKVSQKGNAELNTKYNLALLPDGDYYWSVQAIDGSFIGSPFSPPIMFTITNGELSTFLPPTFSDSLVYISDFLPIDAVVSKLPAKDVDSPILTYTILSGNENNWFKVNNTGQLLIDQRPLVFPDSVSLEIRVSDGANSATGKFVIHFCNASISSVPNLSDVVGKTIISNSTINISSQITGNSKVYFDSKNSITLSPGTVISSGTVFKASIGQGCNNN